MRKIKRGGVNGFWRKRAGHVAVPRPRAGSPGVERALSVAGAPARNKKARARGWGGGGGRGPCSLQASGRAGLQGKEGDRNQGQAPGCFHANNGESCARGHLVLTRSAGWRGQLSSRDVPDVFIRNQFQTRQMLEKPLAGDKFHSHPLENLTGNYVDITSYLRNADPDCSEAIGKHSTENQRRRGC